MKKLFEGIKKQMDPQKILKLTAVLNLLRNPVSNQDGSIIFIALMIMVIMTVIGLMASDTAVTEKFIVRNQGIYRQNINMVESVLMETLQRFMGIPSDDPDIVNPAASNLAWVKDINSTWASTDWYTPNSSSRILNDANSIAISTPCNLADRHETTANNLRSAFVGWEIVSLPGGGSESLVIGANKFAWREGRILGEYLSRISKNSTTVDHGYGMMRLEIGVKRRIVMN